MSKTINLGLEIVASLNGKDMLTLSDRSDAKKVITIRGENNINKLRDFLSLRAIEDDLDRSVE